MKTIKKIPAILVTLSTLLFCIYFISCKKTTDKCASIDCKNGGVCVNGTCSCATGYEGSDCSTLTKNAYLGTYNGNNFCSSNSAKLTTGSMVVTAGTGVNQIIINGIGKVEFGGSNYFVNLSATYQVYAFIDLNTKAITIPIQNDGTNQCQGTGSFLNNNTLALQYTTTNIPLASGIYSSVNFTGSK
jgi:hypothetical protein